MLLVAVNRLDNCVFFWSAWYIQALDGWSHVTLWGTQWVSHLPALFPVSGLLGFVGFDAADVVWSTFHQCAHQVIGLSLKEVKDHNDVKLVYRLNALTELSAVHWLLKDSTHIIFSRFVTHKLYWTRTFILLPAVVGRPFFSAFRFSWNSALMKLLLEDKCEEKLREQKQVELSFGGSQKQKMQLMIKVPRTFV